MNFYRSSLLILFQVISITFTFNVHLLQAHPSNITDKLALLQFKARIISDPQGIFNSWNDSHPFCRWYGISCGRRHQRVTSMVLQGQNLIGSISPFIGNLSFLKLLNLQNNNFSSQIPQEIGNLRRLQVLKLDNNTIEGDIPINLTRCFRIRIISLIKNNLIGKIPIALGSLSKLERLGLGTNNLIGEIPASLGNLTFLRYLYTGNNKLEGSIPNELGGLRLTDIRVHQNKLSGDIPSFVFNSSSIVLFSASFNQFSGTLPNNTRLSSLSNLQRFGIFDNLLSGSIPNSLCNVLNLELFDASFNYFQGHVPNCLGYLQSLQWLNLEGNLYLGNYSSTSLAFLTSLTNCSNLQKLSLNINKFGGVLPNSVANLSVQLNTLSFSENQITGVIPQGIEKLVNLIGLGMGGNLLQGEIPSSFGQLQKLQVLALGGNRFSGRIPSSLGNLTQLSVLSIWQNKLEGNIPTSIKNCQNLQHLDVSDNNLNGPIPNEVLHIVSLSILLNLSHNSLSGELPADVGKLTSINVLDVSANRLSGKIPAAIGACLGLEYLYMQGNSFQGTMPSSMASLKGLQELDLSRNNLTGEIPDFLQSLQFLSHLNLSFNNLVGEIPRIGVFRNASAVSLMGNNMLCGGVLQLHQPKCPSKSTKKGRSIALKLAIIIPCAIFFCMLFILVVVLAYRKRAQKRRSDAAPEGIDSLVKVSYRDLFDATSGFSTDNLIGSGSFSSVYKGFVNPLERHVAIKVLKMERTGASKGFMAECKVLRTVRHKNLVKLLTYCSSIDYKRNEFKALVYELMENGSLNKCLHRDINGNDQSECLNLLQRLNIAIDVATALHYLHDLCETPIIHCDLKPSNVLLDKEMVAHVSDFGLARLCIDTSQSSSLGIRGTIGYAPPEYGMGSAASKEGDVYSYGILVLEMFSGRRPTDKLFQDHLNLHNLVKNALPNGVAKIMDPTLHLGGMEETPVAIAEADLETEEGTSSNQRNTNQMGSKEKDCLVSVLQIGVGCSAESPQERMKMRDVAKELHFIKSNILGVRIYG